MIATEHQTRVCESLKVVGPSALSPIAFGGTLCFSTAGTMIYVQFQGGISSPGKFSWCNSPMNYGMEAVKGAELKISDRANTLRIVYPW